MAGGAQVRPISSSGAHFHAHGHGNGHSDEDLSGIGHSSEVSLRRGGGMGARSRVEMVEKGVSELLEGKQSRQIPIFMSAAMKLGTRMRC